MEVCGCCVGKDDFLAFGGLGFTRGDGSRDYEVSLVILNAGFFVILFIFFFGLFLRVLLCRRYWDSLRRKRAFSSLPSQNLRALVAHLRSRTLSISLRLPALCILYLPTLLLPILLFRDLFPLLRLQRLHQSLIQLIIYKDMVIITGLQTCNFILQSL